VKLAISGKGGVGKSTLAAALSLLMARRGMRVLALDADPDANLAGILGIPEEKQEHIVTIADQADLIEERTGAKIKKYGQIFKLNPEVSDISENYTVRHEGVALLVLGAVSRGGGGCACPENVLIRALVTDLILFKDDVLIMDMEAGVEHLGRATAHGVDAMVVVLEPGQSAIESTRRIIRLAGEIGLNNILLVANKVTGPDDERFIREAFSDYELIGIIPYAKELRWLDRRGYSLLDGMPGDLQDRFENILDHLVKMGKDTSSIENTEER
jgi:CO dehydrogenase maturation factor